MSLTRCLQSNSSAPKPDCHCPYCEAMFTAGEMEQRALHERRLSIVREYKERLVNKLVEKGVLVLTDSEIERAFGETVGGQILVRLAKDLRDQGSLTDEDLIS